MASRTLRVQSSPSDELNFRNVAAVRSKPDGWEYVKVTTAKGKDFYLYVAVYIGGSESELKEGDLGVNKTLRSWMDVKPGESVEVAPFSIPPSPEYFIATISLELEYNAKQSKPQPEIDTEELSKYFAIQFNKNVFSNGQKILIAKSKPYFRATVQSIEVFVDEGGKRRMKSSPHGYGLVHADTIFLYESKKGSGVRLSGKFKAGLSSRPVISPDWDFNAMGIGGLDKEFSDIFRRAFASRVFPADVIEKLGMKHVRGILLYGPPGTGKTLIARTIGNMLTKVEPKIVNGPEIFDKHVGESEKKMRELFADAEAAHEELKSASPLHIIIFDEIDAVCRARGSLAGTTGVQDTVVNQLLSKMDGVKQLNNILVIGMTNRKDMIDEALLRPGRLEVQMEISLPDKDGRLQILTIHTSKLKENNMLGEQVDLQDLAEKTKNFSGAELAGLVRSATTTAMNKLIKVGINKELGVDPGFDKEMASTLKVTREDFTHALSHDITPAFGSSEDQLDRFIINNIIEWCPRIQEIINRGDEAVTTVMESQRESLMSMLLHGPPDTGKTALAVHIAKNSGITFVKVISPEDMVGFSESAKCNVMNKVFEDAYKSKDSCVIIDNIERLLEYVAVGPKFSNLVYQTLLVLLKKTPPKTDHRILIIGTTGMDHEVLEKFALKKAFHIREEVPSIKTGSQILTVVKYIKTMTDSKKKKFKFEVSELVKKSGLTEASCDVGIKRLLKIMEAAIQKKDSVQEFVARLKTDADMKLTDDTLL